MKASPLWHHTKRRVGMMILLFIIALSPSSAADDFETYQSKERHGVRTATEEFVKYKEQEDREFASFLKSRWREFETYKGIVRIAEPKPRQIPVAPQTEKPVKARPSVPKIDKQPPSHVPEPPPLKLSPLPTEPKPAPTVQTPTKPHLIEISFYGNRVLSSFDERWRKYRLPKGVQSEVMSAFWTMMSGSKYDSTLRDISQARRELKLDDWGYVSLWREAVRALQPELRSEQNLLLWFFLVKSGYDVRLGYSGSDIHLFVAVKQQVYSTKFTTVGSQTYYAILASDHGDSIGSFYTYEASYPNKLNALDLGSASTGFTKAAPTQRDLTFEYKGKPITLGVSYDRELVNYVGSYPQSEFPLYFDTDGSSLLRQGLLKELKRHTARMDEEETINFLLAFVQNSFAYKTDDEQFGREKYFFVEESLHYPYNDCEDRSVLFSWLVSNVAGIKTIGLVYPGHMTTAVALKNIKPGYATTDYQGDRFVIADPTYIGATVGMAMPSYVNLKPKKLIKIQH